MEKLKKIGVMSAPLLGKEWFLEDILCQWPMITTPKKQAKDWIKKQKNFDTEETQEKILNYVIDQAMENHGKKKVLLDPNPLDSLAYCLWLFDQGKVSEVYMDKIVSLVRTAMTFYSLILYIPLTQENDWLIKDLPAVSEADKAKRNAFAIYYDIFFRSWEKGGARFFDNNNLVPIIPIYGSRIERLALTSLYITKEGEFYGDEQNLVGDFLKEDKLGKHLFKQLEKEMSKDTK